MIEITDDEKQHIRLSEEYRSQIAASLAKGNKASWLNENTKWILATIVIPLCIAAYKGIEAAQNATRQQEETARKRITEQEETKRAELRQNAGSARANSQLLVAMLDAFSDAKNEERQQMALAVLTYLQEQAELPPELGAIFRTAAGRIVARFAAGNQTASDTAVVRSLSQSFSEGKKSPENLALLNSAASAIDSETSQKNSPQSNLTATVALPPRVYIQIFREQDRESMQKVSNALANEKILSPRIENVIVTAKRSGSTPPIAHKQPSILYFRPSDENIARRIAEIAEKSSASKFTLLSATDRAGKTRPGHIELWMPDS